MTAAGLRALLAKATPGPWMSGGEAGIALTFDREINILPPDTMESHGFQYGGPVAVVSTGGEGENADLIVALRNNAKRFAELLEREEAQWVDICIIEPTTPFITSVSAGWGKPALDSIEEELTDGDWENLPGVPPEAVTVRCKAHHCEAQIGDEGRIELPAYWDLTPIGYEVMDGEGVSTRAAVEAAVRAGR